MTLVLSAGPVHTMEQDVIYSLPASRCVIQSSDVIEVSLTSTTTDFASLAASTTGTECFAKFVRSTTRDTVICVKKT
jgi:hypothetical protein